MLNDFGQEVPDDTPMVVHFKGRTISQFDQVREFIRRELREHQTGEVETFEDANDFDVEDDLLPLSPHEYDADTEAADAEVVRAGDPTHSRPTGKPEVPTGGTSSESAVQAGSAPPAPSEPPKQ